MTTRSIGGRTLMKLCVKAFTIFVMMCLLTGCGAKRDLVAPPPEDPDFTVPPREHRDLIILLADPDGKTGVVRVTSPGGSQVLDRPGYATEVADAGAPPTAPKPMDESEIKGIFESALSAQPDLADRFVSFILYFDRDTIRLTSESKKLVMEVAKTVKTRRSNEVFVVGHTDRVGTEEYNLELSSRRAFYVRDMLVSSGIQAKMLVVSYHGEAIPQVNTEDEVAEPLNRRVEVIVR
jgi:outer membrane protein OmpA-like peptidoglycan-associated protein/predicted small lipoprotein YifL